MSGGSLNYFYSDLESHIGDFGDRELDDLVRDLAELFHDREWCLSGDIGEGSWNKARDDFKAKWFSAHGREERIEKYLDEINEEVRKTFGMSVRYCRNCAYWEKEEKDGYDDYGKCVFHKSCLMHSHDSCNQFSN